MVQERTRVGWMCGRDSQERAGKINDEEGERQDQALNPHTVDMRRKQEGSTHGRDTQTKAGKVEKAEEKRQEQTLYSDCQ